MRYGSLQEEGTPMTIVIDTEDVAPHERAHYWREMVWEVWRSLRAEPESRQFKGSIVLSDFGQVSIARIKTDAQVVRRAESDPVPDCLVAIQLSGIGHVCQGDRVATLRPGEMAAYDGLRAYELSSPGAKEQLVLRFPRNELIERNIDVESIVARRIPGVGAAVVTRSLAQSLLSNGDDIPGSLRESMGQQVVDCMAMAISLRPGALNGPDKARVGDRQRILHFVDANIPNPNLSVKMIAVHFGVSTRTLQKLFQHEDMYLSAHIRLARLTHARRALLSPFRAHQTITRISGDFGFSHPSHFAREFRAEFGCSPGDFRTSLPEPTPLAPASSTVNAWPATTRTKENNS